jgi:hypothetical protein
MSQKKKEEKVIETSSGGDKKKETQPQGVCFQVTTSWTTEARTVGTDAGTPSRGLAPNATHLTP